MIGKTGIFLASCQAAKAGDHRMGPLSDPVIRN
jgi:hypothetical protein